MIHFEKYSHSLRNFIKKNVLARACIGRQAEPLLDFNPDLSRSQVKISILISAGMRDFDLDSGSRFKTLPTTFSNESIARILLFPKSIFKVFS